MRLTQLEQFLLAYELALRPPQVEPAELEELAALVNPEAQQACDRALAAIAEQEGVQ